MITRRKFLKAGAGLSIAFALPLRIAGAAGQAGAGADARLVKAWLDIDRNGKVTLQAGKVELGTGLQTAMAQLVAEELDVAMADVIVVMGDTATAIDQGPTVGSMSLLTVTPPIRRAAATARAAIVARAARKMDVPVHALATRAGHVHMRDDNLRTIAYQDLLGDAATGWSTLEVDNAVPLKKAADFGVIGHEVPRIELPAKVKGSHAYLHNLRMPGMLHARVIHPPYPGATLKRVKRNSIARRPGNIILVVKENFVAVASKSEWNAITASRALEVEWTLPHAALDSAAVYDDMAAQDVPPKAARSKGDVQQALGASGAVLKAVYRTPFQTHGSIGPSCGVADVRKDGATIWSATQGPFPLRKSLADMLRLPADRVRVIWMEGAGCYGQNGADDAAAEAALLSQMLGAPVRVQWMRHDEHGWDPKGPAMEIDARGMIGADGAIHAWQYQVSSPTHVSRPNGTANNLLPAQLLGLPPKTPMIGADHCARTLYQFPNENVAIRWLPKGALRSSAMRGLGAFANTFANESFIDELAATAGIDPIDLRRKHLADPRAIAVLDDVRRLSRWDSLRKSSHSAGGDIRRGTGVGFVRLEPEGAYVATVCCVDVDVKSGAIRVASVYVSHDCGLIVNPDGLRNQIEGCVIQSISRTLKEEVRFSGREMQSLNWSSYPIIRFSEIPETVTISLIDRPDQPVVGAGEPAAMTLAPAIANAVFHATGARLRQIPFTPARFIAAKQTAEKAG